MCTHLQIKALWEDLKQLTRDVVEEMNRSAEFRSKTGGLDCQLEDPDTLIVSKQSVPKMYVTVGLRCAAIAVGRGTVFTGADSAPEVWESLRVLTFEGEATLQNKRDEVLTVDQAVYYILRPFLHAGTFVN